MRVAIIAALLLMPVQALALENTTGNRIAAANRYVEATDLNALCHDVISGLLSNLTAEQQDRARDQLKHVNIERLIERMRAVMVDAMVQTFTADELQALADFYGSPMGHAILQKFGHYTGVAEPALQDIVRDSIKQ